MLLTIWTALFAMVLTLLPAVGAGAAYAAETSPEATVREAYAITIRELADIEAGKKATQPPFRPPHRQRLMTKELSALFARDEQFMTESRDQGHMDFDPFISGQDGEVKQLRVTVSERSAESATVFADFFSFGPVRVTFRMKLEDGRWRIDDIVNWMEGKDYTVRSQLSQPYDCGSFMKKPCKR
ncbi:DUF3828 domain-containing protein [Bosea sp. 685]|uniref:DUF3828 domain-containing protein n=1 Tax=Bosea sp. 685 TaxID=3080057 RepID=UPI0028933CA8|nr:DUF3828 domain-containing protein [Bosea sp. 685]WNJ91904.1 DUF3828 domain-containing protein [Bosea sp. 685]